MSPEEARIVAAELSSLRRLLTSALGRVQLIEDQVFPVQVGYVIEVSRVGEKPR